ncbi:hypothetical protein [Streptomyces noursei]|uniref:hypothetical protein n=1 Tax=Streptomyces noursei TaxID=1971 RepID=UPI0030F2842E
MRTGTVGRDVLTVHELIWVGDALRPRCGDAGLEDEAVEWRRSVNCPECLRCTLPPSACLR